MTTPLTFEGRVAWVFPDDFHTTEILGAEGMYVANPEALAKICMRDFDPHFNQVTEPGDILVAGRNLGYGQPNELAMKAMRAVGIALVIAESFGPMFERTNHFLGIPILVCPGIAGAVDRWDEIEVDWPAGLVTLPDGSTLSGPPPSPRRVELARAGGWFNLTDPELSSREGSGA